MYIRLVNGPVSLLAGMTTGPWGRGRWWGVSWWRSFGLRCGEGGTGLEHHGRVCASLRIYSIHMGYEFPQCLDQFLMCIGCPDDEGGDFALELGLPVIPNIGDNLSGVVLDGIATPNPVEVIRMLGRLYFERRVLCGHGHASRILLIASLASSSVSKCPDSPPSPSPIT